MSNAARVESYSSLAMLAECDEKYRLSYVERLESGTSAPQKAGSCLDRAFNHLYVTAWDEAGAIAALRAEWGDFKLPLGSRHSWLTLPFLEERVRLYMREREARPTILEEGKVVAAYSGGEAHVFDWSDAEGNLVRLRGIPDFVLKHAGKTYVPDVKCTTSWISDHWMLQFRLGHQLRIYAAMFQNLEGERVDGGLINAVYMGEKALDPPEAWKKRTSVPSAVSPVDFTQEQIAEAHTWARGLILRRDAAREHGLWPRNEKACGAYGGCQFLDLCTAPSRSVRLARMMTAFKRKEEA